MIPERATFGGPENTDEDPRNPQILKTPEIAKNSRVRVSDFGGPQKGHKTGLIGISRVKTAQNTKILHALYS